MLVTFPIILLKVLGLRSTCWTLSNVEQPFFGNLLNGFFKKSPVVASAWHFKSNLLLELGLLAIRATQPCSGGEAARSENCSE